MKRNTMSTLSRCAANALGLALLLCVGGVQAQMFKWVDDKGVTHYSDMPPPSNKKAHTLRPTAAGGADAALPFELADAARNHPVTLYTTGQCEACDQGRALLRARGIPYSEKTVSSEEDSAKLKEAGGAGQLPLLLIGRNKLVGFEAGAWNSALSNASYPAQKMLPPSYQQPKAVAAAPAAVANPEVVARAAARAAAAEAAAQAERERKLSPVNAPPGFRF